MYLFVENEVSRTRLLKLGARMDRQTHRRDWMYSRATFTGGKNWAKPEWHSAILCSVVTTGYLVHCFGPKPVASSLPRFSAWLDDKCQRWLVWGREHVGRHCAICRFCACAREHFTSAQCCGVMEIMWCRFCFESWIIQFLYHH